MTLANADSAANAAALSVSADASVSAVDTDDILRHLPDAALLVDTDASLVWANPAAERLFGLSADQASGLSGLDFIHPDDLALAALSMTSVQDKEVGSPIELRVLSQDGWRLVEVIGSPIGEMILLSIRDLTDRRRWEVAGNEVALFRSLVQNAASITMLVRADGIVDASSAALTRILGQDPEWMQGRPLTDLAEPDDRLALQQAITGIQDGSTSARRQQITVRLNDAEGGAKPFALTIANLLDDPTVEGLVVSGHDITELVAAEADLRAANSVLAATLEATADGILVVDGSGVVTSANSRFTELRLLDDAGMRHVVGAAMSDVLTHFEDRHTAEARMSDFDENPELETHDIVVLPDGRVVELDSRPQHIQGEVVGRVWSFRDITQHRRLEDELTHRAFHDSLTDLPNQALFRDRLEHAILRLHRTDEQLAVMFVDLDDFKSVNDSLGHPAGDELLRVIADRLSVCLRQIDTVARLGGDEFAVLLEGLVDEAMALDVADRINDTLNRPVRSGQRRLMTTASIGIAFGDASSDCDELLRNADLAMYHAKANGKNCHRIFESSMHALALDRFEIEADLRGAAGRDELVVHYQPIHELVSGRVVALEALVRWRHPTRGLMSPDQFIPVAEETGLVHEVGAHVMLAACREAAGWKSALGADAPAVTVNLSPSQLLDADLSESIAEVLRTTALPASLLILEITESALIDDPVTAVACLQRLSALGIRIAVDDFGTGYSALSYLQQFPIDWLKIDKSFTTNLEGGRGLSLVKAIIQLAHSLGIVPVAEGVETVEHLAAMRRLGCDLVQGFHLSRPLGADDTRHLLGLSAG